MPQKTLAILSLILSAAIFGFFYAWTVSTMWGLDQADPKIAIAAMQSMNASVRNAAFAPAFFGTAPMFLITALAARATPRAALLFLAAGLIYGLAAMGLTMAINVPMNEALAATTIPEDPAQAAEVWTSYSAPWQTWNQIRTLTSGLAFVTGLAGLIALVRA